MISINLVTPYEMMKKIAENAKATRLTFNLSQKTLSEQSGVSYGVIKKFEQTGQISLESLLKISLVLDSIDHFNVLFEPNKPEKILSLDELMQDCKRKRGRR